jgi:hypothetical protein
VILAPLFAAVAGLLALAGALKLRAPGSGSGAYPAPGSALGIRGARTVGAFEVLLGGFAVAAPGRLVAAALAAAFAAFAAYSLRMIVAADGQDAGCGCFGDSGETVRAGHVALDLAAAGIALAATIDPPRALASLLADAPLQGTALAAGVVASVYALYLSYTALPSAWRAFEGRVD